MTIRHSRDVLETRCICCECSEEQRSANMPAIKLATVVPNRLADVVFVVFIVLHTQNIRTQMNTHKNKKHIVFVAISASHKTPIASLLQQKTLKQHYEHERCLLHIVYAN